MIIAAAQTKPVQGALHDNLEDHFRYIKLAAQHNAELILFPELSLSSYVREDGEKLSLTIYDACINILRDYALNYNIVIIAGAPAQIKTDLHIGAFILTPEGAVDIYTKQYLHDGEEHFYKPSFEHDPLLYIGDYKSKIAICADIEHPQHSRDAARINTKLYLASIFYSPQSITGAHTKLANYAAEHNLNILMSNFTGEAYDMKAGGGSAFWNADGELVAKLDNDKSGLLVIEEEDSKWSGQAFYL